MYILDTDHVSLLEKGGSAGTLLEERLRRVPLGERTTTIISFEEQMRGWLGYLSRARSLVHQIEGYRRMKGQLETYCSMVILTFNEASAVEFQKLRQARVRIGTLDLKIAAIVLAHSATLLTRNLVDFRKVPGLKIEDWTK